MNKFVLLTATATALCAGVAVGRSQNEVRHRAEEPLPYYAPAANPAPELTAGGPAANRAAL